MTSDNDRNDRNDRHGDEDDFDAVLAVLRHAVANDLVAVQAGIDVLGDHDPDTARLVEKAVAHTRQLLGGRIEQHDATTKAQQRALWLLTIVVAGCHEMAVTADTETVRVTARGRVRSELVSWATRRAKQLGGTLEATDGGAVIVLGA